MDEEGYAHTTIGQEIGAGWTAYVEHRAPSGIHWGYLRADIRAMNKPLALATAQGFLDRYAKGKLAIVRARPEATTDKDFATNEVTHKGYVRFLYKDEPGEWTFTQEHPQEIRYLGFGKPNPPTKGERIVIDDPHPEGPATEAQREATKAWFLNRPPALQATGVCDIHGDRQPLSNLGRREDGLLVCKDEALTAYEVHDISCACDRCWGPGNAGVDDPFSLTRPEWRGK